MRSKKSLLTVTISQYFTLPSFARYLDSVITRLIKKYKLSKKTIIEIGAGDGYVLRKLCSIGKNMGIGIDPGFKHEPLIHPDYLVHFHQEHYDERHAELESDFLLCRHVLNAIPDPVAFLKTIRKNLDNSPECTLYIEST